MNIYCLIGSGFVIPYQDIVIRLVLAVLLGGLIGIERQRGNHDAGLKTHILVCLGAAGIMVMSQNLYMNFNTDISRIGAQVVSGIGFLGAGCILVNGNKIKGLTTAAGLWTTACVGLIVGIGYYFIAAIIVALTLLTTLLLKPIANLINSKKRQVESSIKVTSKNGFEAISKHFYETMKITFVSEVEPDVFVIKFTNNDDGDMNDFITDLIEDKNIISVEKLH